MRMCVCVGMCVYVCVGRCVYVYVCVCIYPAFYSHEREIVKEEQITPEKTVLQPYEDGYLL